MLNIFQSASFAFDGTSVNLGIAFISGIITFFASCLLPLVPTYLAYISGVSLHDKEFSKNERLKIFTTALFFVLGFITTFVIIGLGLQHISTFLTSHREIIQRIAGALFILLSLVLLGIIHPTFLSQERKLPLQKFFKKYLLVHAFLTGSAFSLSWTPCVGPVLAVILYWASQAETALRGSILLVFFGLGVGLPFLFIALGFEKILPHIKKYAKFGHYLSIISAVFIFLMGVLLLIGQFQNVSSLTLRFFNQHFKTF